MGDALFTYLHAFFQKYGIVQHLVRRTILLGADECCLPKHEAITLTGSAGDVLLRDKKVQMFVRKRISHGRTTVGGIVDEGLFDALRALRLKLALKENVPAYIIFTNAVLQEMAAKKPTTMTEFLNVSGIGEYKAKQYGDQKYEESQREDGSGQN